jgi:hypothetical protein
MLFISYHYSTYFSFIFSMPFHISTCLSSMLFISYQYSTYFSSIFSKSFHYSTYLSNVFQLSETSINSYDFSCTNDHDITVI